MTMDPASDIAMLSRMRNIRTAEERGDSRVQRAFSGATIFITGGTGFLGKQLIEKLFRSCRDIKKVYVLSRDKKGKSMEERLKETLQDPVFDEVRKVNSYFEKRLVPVAGDVAELRLGLSDDDWNMLAEEVNFIYHIAATVKFDEPLKVAILTNARGTREAITLAKETKDLKTFVYVSTAFSNCYNEEAFEKFYPTPVSAQTIIDLVETFDEERLDAITREILGGWPNTYSFSKAIAEDAVRTMATDIPTCVVRPGIVVPTACEPVPGWMDIGNVFGPSGILLGIGLGVTHTTLVNPDVRQDVVPVDYVNNLTIAATWDTVKRYERGHRDIKIYTLSNIRNFINYNSYVDVLDTEGRQLVTPKAMWYCGAIHAENKYTLFLFTLFMHYIPAFFVDIVLKLRGSKLRLMKIYKKAYRLNLILSYFMVREFRLHDDNTVDLFNRLSKTDRTIFHFDVADVDFRVFTKYWWLGLRKYILKDGLKGTARAVQKQKWLKVANYVLVIMYAFTVYKLLVFTGSILWMCLRFIF
ncbi:fatty acyl-CoA reductase wat [Plutella xylostella]|uniref:fatty acyl-CoA reductase wat n=1 Tax=Plutella xylostella TaxID=51655 RepID=UPI002032D7E9|nr:fatty acyl-CoA reductase wat [Plutella xylostella]